MGFFDNVHHALLIVEKNDDHRDDAENHGDNEADAVARSVVLKHFGAVHRLLVLPDNRERREDNHRDGLSELERKRSCRIEHGVAVFSGQNAVALRDVGDNRLRNDAEDGKRHADKDPVPRGRDP